MSATLPTLAQAGTWRSLGTVPDGAFREADILYDPTTGKYYVFSTGSYSKWAYQVNLGSPTTGTWTLTVGGQTATLTAGWSANQIQTAIEALTPTLVGNVVVATGNFVTGTQGFNIWFDRSIAMPATAANVSLGGGSVTFTFAAQGAVFMWVADAPELITHTTPITVATGVYPTCTIDGATGYWHLYSEKFGAPGSGSLQHWIATSTPTGMTAFTLQAQAGLSFGVIDTCVRKGQSATVNTSIAGGIGATGTQFVSPVSLSGIAVGTPLVVVDSDGKCQELVTVTNTTGSTFQAAFRYPHAAGCLVRTAWFACGISNGTPPNQFLYIYYADGPHGKVTGTGATATFVGKWYPLAAAPAWTITITGASGSDTFTVSYGGDTTSALAYNALGTTIRSAIQALPSLVHCSVASTGAPSTGGMTVTLQAQAGFSPFTGTLTGSLTGGGTLTIVQNNGGFPEVNYGVFLGPSVSVPSWAAYATPDPNLAFTADGKAYILFSGRPDAISAGSVGMVEVDMATGWAASAPVQLPSSYPSFIASGYGLSDVCYVPSQTPTVYPGRMFAFTNDNEAGDKNCEWAWLDIPSDTGGYYGEGYPNNHPAALTIQVGCGTAGALVDVSADVDRLSVRLRRDAASGMVTASFAVSAHLDLIGGTRYVIQDWQTVRITDPDTGDAWFMGYVTEVSDSIEGAEKVYTLTCQSVQIDLTKPTRQITTQYPPGDGTPVVLATGLTPVGTGTQSFTLLSSTSARNLYGPYTDANGQPVRGRKCIAQNLDGTNREVITIISISGLTVSAAFATTKSSGWTLTGGLPAYDLVGYGWKQTDTDGVMRAYLGLVDEYFRTPPGGYTALPMRKVVTDTNMSLPHTKLAVTTPGAALQSIVEQSTTTGYRRTCTSSFTAGTDRTIHPDSLTGIASGGFIYLANSNGSNPERQMVKSVNSGAGTFVVDLTYSKTGSGPDPWIINTGTAPVCYETWDNTFTRMLVFLDLYDFTLTTPIELTDASTITAAQSHYNTGNERRISGTDRGSKVTVIGANNAQGSYEDTSISTAMGRVVELPPVSRDDLLTNADCVVAAQQIVAGFSKSKESFLSLSTHQRISPMLFRTANLVRVTSNLEGGTPAYYPFQDVELEFSEGMARYNFTVGDRLAELGDKAIPAYGAGSFIDRTAPSAPTWDTSGPAPGAWVLVNTYVPYSHDVTIEVQATLGGELDLREAHFAYRQNSGRWNYSPPVAVSGGATSATYLVRGLTVGAVVDWFAWDVDTSGNPSDPSSTISVTASAVVNPVAPTATGEASNRYNGSTGETDVLESFTPATQPPGINVVSYQATVTPTGSYTRFYYGCTGSPYPLLNLPPGVSCDLLLFAVTDDGFISGPSSTRTFTTAASPAGRILYNGDFAIKSEFDATKPDGWTETSVSGGAGVIATGVTSPKVPQVLQITCAGGFLPAAEDTWLSRKVAAISADSVTGTQFQLYGRCVFWVDKAIGRVQIGIRHYDISNALIKTDYLYNATPPAANALITRSLAVVCPTNTMYARGYIDVLGSTGGTTQTVNIGVFDLGPASVSSASAAGLIATTDTTGWLAEPSVAGTPSVAPDLATGSVGAVNDTTGERIVKYMNGHNVFVGTTLGPNGYFSPLTNGSTSSPDLIYISGDVIMIGG